MTKDGINGTKMMPIVRGGSYNIYTTYKWNRGTTPKILHQLDLKKKK